MQLLPAPVDGILLAGGDEEVPCLVLGVYVDRESGDVASDTALILYEIEGRGRFDEVRLQNVRVVDPALLYRLRAIEDGS